MTSKTDAPWQMKDVVPLAIMNRQPFAYYVNANSPYKTWADVEKAAKTKDIKVAVDGFGSAEDVATKYFASRGLKLVGVPFPKPGERYAALLGDQVDVMCDPNGNVRRYVESGQIRPVVVFSAKRVPAIPNTPHRVRDRSKSCARRVALDRREGRHGSREGRISFGSARDVFINLAEFQDFLKQTWSDPDSYVAGKDVPAYLFSSRTGDEDAASSDSLGICKQLTRFDSNAGIGIIFSASARKCSSCGRRAQKSHPKTRLRARSNTTSSSRGTSSHRCATQRPRKKSASRSRAQVGHALVDQTVKHIQVLGRSQARSLVRADGHLQPQESVRQSAGCRRAFEARWLLVSQRLSAGDTRCCGRARDQRVDESRGRDRQQRRGRALQLGNFAGRRIYVGNDQERRAADPALARLSDRPDDPQPAVHGPALVVLHRERRTDLAPRVGELAGLGFSRLQSRWSR